MSSLPPRLLFTKSQRNAALLGYIIPGRKADSHPFSRRDMQCSFFVMILYQFPLVYAREGMDFNTTEVMMFEFGNDPSDVF